MRLLFQLFFIPLFFFICLHPAHSLKESRPNTPTANLIEQFFPYYLIGDYPLFMLNTFTHEENFELNLQRGKMFLTQQPIEKAAILAEEWEDSASTSQEPKQQGKELLKNAWTISCLTLKEAQEKAVRLTQSPAKFNQSIKSISMQKYKEMKKEIDAYLISDTPLSKTTFDIVNTIDEIAEFIQIGSAASAITETLLAYHPPDSLKSLLHPIVAKSSAGNKSGFIYKHSSEKRPNIIFLTGYNYTRINENDINSLLFKYFRSTSYIANLLLHPDHEKLKASLLLYWASTEHIPISLIEKYKMHQLEIYDTIYPHYKQIADKKGVTLPLPPKEKPEKNLEDLAQALHSLATHN